MLDHKDQTLTSANTAASCQWITVLSPKYPRQTLSHDLYTSFFLGRHLLLNEVAILPSKICKLLTMQSRCRSLRKISYILADSFISMVSNSKRRARTAFSCLGAISHHRCFLMRKFKCIVGPRELITWLRVALTCNNFFSNTPRHSFTLALHRRIYTAPHDTALFALIINEIAYFQRNLLYICQLHFIYCNALPDFRCLQQHSHYYMEGLH